MTLFVLSMAAAVVTLLTYLALTTGHASVKAYDIVNVAAAPPIVAYSALCRAWPSVLLSGSYGIAAAVGLLKKRRKPEPQTRQLLLFSSAPGEWGA